MKRDVLTKRLSVPIVPSYNIIKDMKNKNHHDIIEEGSSDEDYSSENNSNNNSSSEEARKKDDKKIPSNKNIRKDKKKEQKKEPKNETSTDMNQDYRKVTGKYKNYNGFSLSSSKISKQLKEILMEKLCLKDFSDWFNSVIISMQTDDLNEFVTLLDCLQEGDNLTTEFFKYIYNLSKSKSKGYKYTYEADKLYKQNKLEQICFITPEIGRWTSLGKLGQTVDELTQGLCALGQDIIIISPYYYKNSRGKTDYLEDDPCDIKYLKDVSISLDDNYTFEIYQGISETGIKYYFMKNQDIFPKIYPQFDPADTLREIACFAKASLQLLCDLRILPPIIVTNDWTTGLTPAYGKDGSFGDAFKHTKFIHLCHNLEPEFEGRLSYNGNNYENIYQFNPEWLIDPYANPKCFNPSRCAILKSDQWATVSKSYKRHLQLDSPLAELLNQKPCPFAYPNGVFINQKLNVLKGLDKNECKKYIQQNYFEYNEPDYSVPVFSFIGPIIEERGVMLILNAFEELVKKTNEKINVLIYGIGNNNDPYFKDCVYKMNNLKERYPYSFWGDINQNPKDTLKLYLGSDFGLIPSRFEPGGVDQFEYFLGGTPVFAFKTGSLKDIISEFNYQTNHGNGIMFDYYNINDFTDAFLRSVNLFNNKEKYDICCKNAKNSVIDISEVSKAYCKEFCKLKHKIFFDNSKIKDLTMSNISENMLVKDYKIAQSSNNVKDNLIPGAGRKRKSNFFGLDSFQSKNLLSKFEEKNKNENVNNYLKEDEVIHKFVYHYLNNYQPKVVEISGSFDNWKKRHRLIHYPREKKWEIAKKVKKGKNLYKYIIDGDWQINPREPSEKGDDGIVNNVITL